MRYSATRVATVIKLRSRLERPGRSQMSPKRTSSLSSINFGAKSLLFCIVSSLVSCSLGMVYSPSLLIPCLLSFLLSVWQVSCTVGRTDPGTGSQGKLFFFNDTATTEIYTLSLHDVLPI